MQLLLQRRQPHGMLYMLPTARMAAAFCVGQLVGCNCHVD